MDAILVMGYSSSTKSVVELLSKEYIVYVSDTKINEIALNNVIPILQENIEDYLNLCKFVVKSPGIPYHNEYVKKIKENNIPIYTEIEIAYQKKKRLELYCNYWYEWKDYSYKFNSPYFKLSYSYNCSR